MLPDLARMASPRERSVIYGLILFAEPWLLQSGRPQCCNRAEGRSRPTFRARPGWLRLMALLVLLLRLLWRGTQPAPILSQAAE